MPQASDKSGLNLVLDINSRKVHDIRMNIPTIAVAKSVLLSGRDFTAFFDGRIEISVNPHSRHPDRLHICFGSGRQSLFVAQQIIDVNAGDKTERLALPTLDSIQGPDFSTGELAYRPGLFKAVR